MFFISMTLMYLLQLKNFSLKRNKKYTSKEECDKSPCTDVSALRLFSQGNQALFKLLLGSYFSRQAATCLDHLPLNGAQKMRLESG